MGRDKITVAYLDLRFLCKSYLNNDVLPVHGNETPWIIPALLKSLGLSAHSSGDFGHFM
jgi:hypothetical protein